MTSDAGAVRVAGRVRLFAVLAVMVLLFSTTGSAVEIVNPVQDTVSAEFVSLQVDIAQPLRNLTYAVNGEDQGICRCVSQSVPVRLKEGTNTIIVTAVPMDSGQTDTDTISIVADRLPPQLSIEPAGTVFNRTPRITVTYRDTATGVDPGSVRVRVDGDPVAGETTSSRFTGRVAKPLEAGEHVVRAEIADEQGHATTGEQRFTIPEGPVFQEVYPQGTVDSRRVTLSAAARHATELDDEVSFLVRGVSEENFNYDTVIPAGDVNVEQGADGSTVGYEGLRLQADGRYMVVLRDGGGAILHRWMFSVDSLPPRIDWLEPGNGSVAAEDVHLSVEAVDEGTGVSRVVFDSGGSTVPAVRDGDRFSATIDRVADDRIMVRAWDAVGNEHEETRQLRIDREPPSVEEVRILPRSTKETVYIAGSVSDDTGIADMWYTINGSRNTSIDGVAGSRESRVMETVDISHLPAGTYPVRIHAADEAGRVGTVTQQVEVDESFSSSFSISNVEPVPGEGQRFAITVTNTGSVVEAVAVLYGGRDEGGVERTVIKPGMQQTFTVDASQTGDSVVRVVGLNAEAAVDLPGSMENSVTGRATADGFVPPGIAAGAVVFLLVVVAGMYLGPGRIRSLASQVRSGLDRKVVRERLGSLWRGSEAAVEKDIVASEGSAAVVVVGHDCPVCDRVFGSRRDLSVHRWKEH